MNKRNFKLERIIWSKIRWWQMLNGISDIQLANSLKVTERTICNYDKDASNLTLDKIDGFLEHAGISIGELLNS